MDYKQGDRLICVNAVGRRGSDLEEGKVYVMEKINAVYTEEIYVYELSGSWYANRFIPATPLLEALC
jgi:hypothetical protein